MYKFLFSSSTALCSYLFFFQWIMNYTPFCKWDQGTFQYICKFTLAENWVFFAFLKCFGCGFHKGTSNIFCYFFVLFKAYIILARQREWNKYVIKICTLKFIHYELQNTWIHGCNVPFSTAAAILCICVCVRIYIYMSTYFPAMTVQKKEGRRKKKKANIDLGPGLLFWKHSFPKRQCTAH